MAPLWWVAPPRRGGSSFPLVRLRFRCLVLLWWCSVFASDLVSDLLHLLHLVGLFRSSPYSHATCCFVPVYCWLFLSVGGVRAAYVSGVRMVVLFMVVRWFEVVLVRRVFVCDAEVVSVVMVVSWRGGDARWWG